MSVATLRYQVRIAETIAETTPTLHSVMHGPDAATRLGLVTRLMGSGWTLADLEAFLIAHPDRGPALTLTTLGSLAHLTPAEVTAWVASFDGQTKPLENPMALAALDTWRVAVPGPAAAACCAAGLDPAEAAAMVAAGVLDPNQAITPPAP